MKKTRPYFYAVPRAALERDAAATLDMLRFDGATVCCNAPSGYYLLRADRAPELARWHSFGIAIDARLMGREPYEVIEAIRTAGLPPTTRG